MELPEPSALRGVVERYATLVARLGEEIGQRPLVLPTADFFPDRFTPDAPSARSLVRRMQAHGGLADIPIEVQVVGSDAPAPASSCSSGACAAPATTTDTMPRLVDRGASWQLNVPAAELAHPVVLTTMAARALGHVFLVETLDEGAAIETPEEATADLCAVALGFGPLMLQGAYIYSKSCGGPSVGRATFVGLPELSMAVALFAEIGRHELRAALRELDTTQRSLLGEAHALVKGNPSLVEQLRSDPRRVAEGHFELREAEPWLVRVLRGKRRAAAHDLPDDFTIADLERVARAAPVARPAPKKKTRHPDELAALVDEALAGTPADAE